MNNQMSFLIAYEPDVVEIPKTLLKNFSKLGIRSNEWSLYCLILYIESEGMEMPTQTELANMMGLSERQVKQIIADLKKKGLLSIGRKGKSKMYSFEGLINKAKSLEIDPVV